LAAAVAALLPAHAAWADPGAPADVYPGEGWTQAATPDAVGWSKRKLDKARHFSKKIGSTAVMIVQHGVVVDAWGDTAGKTEAYSLRKSLLSALIGIAVEHGKIDLTATLAALEIDDNPPLDTSEREATVADLITARSGIYHSALYETRQMAAMRPARGSHPHGTFWYYNNWDFNALGTIYERRTGEKIFEAIARHIAGPLQMEDFRAADGRYVTGAASRHPAYTMRLSARDLARFGLLYLRRGRWKDRQVIPAAWVAESTAMHAALRPDHGYGYMWWTGDGDGCFAHVRVAGHCFFAAGNYGQFVIVMPSLDLVVVHRVDTDVTRAHPSAGQVGRLLALILWSAGPAAAERGLSQSRAAR
jgi:CubicO group peptidase (beta-lactamase class C family)